MLDQKNLIQGLESFGLDNGLAPSAVGSVVDKLNLFFSLVVKWNKTHNLTTITQPQDFLSKHILDSLSLNPFLKAQQQKIKATSLSGEVSSATDHSKLSLLDIGSGAGFPGIPVAIVNPDLNIVSIDSSQKRIAFQRQVIRELALKNVSAVHTRVEDYKQAEFSAITCRAFATISNIVQSSQHLLSKDGVWYLMKGVFPEEELEELEQGEMSEQFKIDSVEAVKIPTLQADRHVVCVRRR